MIDMLVLLSSVDFDELHDRRWRLQDHVKVQGLALPVPGRISSTFADPDGCHYRFSYRTSSSRSSGLSIETRNTLLGGDSRSFSPFRCCKFSSRMRSTWDLINSPNSLCRTSSKSNRGFEPKSTSPWYASASKLHLFGYHNANNVVNVCSSAFSRKADTFPWNS